MTFRINIPTFEGPFDLLLFFIQRDELDIYDIPIAKITDDYLQYLEQMKAIDMDIAAEFIYVAASLMRIKAKMLIPRNRVLEENEEIDPRETLVRRLVEYKRFKDVLEEFEKLEDTRSKLFSRGNTKDELKKIAQTALVDLELESVTIYNLMKAFGNVMRRMEDKRFKTRHQVLKIDYTIEDQQEMIVSLLNDKAKCTFEEIFTKIENRIHAIVTFLAMLEMINRQEIKFISGDGINNFWLTKNEVN